MEEVLIKSHLIITDIHNEYEVNWCGKIFEAKPQLQNNMPIFVVIGDRGRMELNTVDINQIERCAKMLTSPKGRSAISKDSSYIYIIEIVGNETLLGVLTHKRVKSFAPMFDKVGYR